MSLIRMDPFIYLHTPFGVAEAHFLWCRASDVPYQWGCFQVETKENWWWPNMWVRQCENISAARDGDHSPIFLPDRMFNELAPHILRHIRSPFYERARKAAVPF